MKLYYVSPSDEVFEEVKEKAMELWKEVDTDNDEFGYATEKINRIKDIKNFEDNVMFIVAMFDAGNQLKLSNKLSDEAKKAISDRIDESGYLINVFKD